MTEVFVPRDSPTHTTIIAGLRCRHKTAGVMAKSNFVKNAPIRYRPYSRGYAVMQLFSSRSTNETTIVHGSTRDVVAKPEADATNCDDPIGGPQLAAHTADMCVERSPGPAVTPDATHDLLARQYATGRRREQMKKIEFLGSHRDRSSIEVYLTRGYFNMKGPMSNNTVGRV